jgi:hypothetical protein
MPHLNLYQVVQQLQSQLEQVEEIVLQHQDHLQVFQDQVQYQQQVVDTELLEEQLEHQEDQVEVVEMVIHLVHQQQDQEYQEKEIQEDQEDQENHLEVEVDQDLQVE